MRTLCQKERPETESSQKEALNSLPEGEWDGTESQKEMM